MNVKREAKSMFRKEAQIKPYRRVLATVNPATVSNTPANATQENASKDKDNQMGPPSGPANRKRCYPMNTTPKNSSASVSCHTLNLSKTNTPVQIPNFSNQLATSKFLTTPGSTGSNITNVESHVLIAITEGRGNAKCEVGIATIDLRRPHLYISQLSDTHSYVHTLSMLHYFNPVEIITPHTFNQGVVPNELYRLIYDNFPKVQLTAVQRKSFNDALGLQYIKEFSAPEYLNIQLQIIHKFYALSAVAGLLKYAETILSISFAPHTLKIEYNSCQLSTLIDVETAIRLELVESIVEITDRRCSLLSILNYTVTLGGLRNLRANILQPSCDKAIINSRLDCIEELLQNNESFMSALKKILRPFADVEKVLWLCMVMPVQDGNKAGETQLNQVLQLKSIMDTLPNLVETLKMSKCRWFCKINKDLEDSKFNEIKECIRMIIQDDAHVARGTGAHLQRCFAVRPNINGLLDVARKSYSEMIDDIQEKVDNLRECYGLPLRLNNNSIRGFHIVLPIGPRNRSNVDIKDLPPVFIETQYQGNTIVMTTEEIIRINQQAKESLNEIQMMSNAIISELLNNLRAYMGSLYKLCEHVAELDLIVSLAQISSSSNYVRPKFNNYMELKDSIHPILDCLLPSTPVPNDVFCSPEYNFNIITGPNMGGKSIYIKQIALLQVMAQIGCFVPATSAVFRITDRIFSRIGFNDNIECNASTYVLEMKEMQHILQSLTPSSLIIIDEFCRGTSSEEGTSMAWAICEHLLNTQAFTFFTTHFLYLTKLQDLYFNVTNLYTETIYDQNGEKNTGIVYKYKILAGINNIDNYGLILAKNTNLPKSVISLAEDLAKIIIKHKKPLPVSDVAPTTHTGDLLLYKLASKVLHNLHNPNISNDLIKEKINKFKVENLSLLKTFQLEEETNCHITSDYNKLVDEITLKLANVENESFSFRQDSPALKDGFPLVDRLRSFNFQQKRTDVNITGNQKIIILDQQITQKSEQQTFFNTGFLQQLSQGLNNSSSALGSKKANPPSNSNPDIVNKYNKILNKLNMSTTDEDNNSSSDVDCENVQSNSDCENCETENNTSNFFHTTTHVDVDCVDYESGLCEPDIMNLNENHEKNNSDQRNIYF